MTTTTSETRSSGSSRTPQDRLRRVLKENFALSASTGLVAAVGFVPLAELFDVPRAAVLVVGLGLLAYAPMLWQFSKVPRLQKSHALIPALGDEAWVIASVLIAGFGLGGMSLAGRLILLATCVPVGIFAVRQWSLARRL